MAESRRRLAEKWAVVAICFALATCYVLGEFWNRKISVSVLFWISAVMAVLLTAYYVWRRGVADELMNIWTWVCSRERREWLGWLIDPRLWKNRRGPR